MPNYDFRCIECKHKFSKMVPFSEKDNVSCPECGNKAKQIFTGFLYKKAAGSDSSCSGSSCKTCSGC